MSKMTVVDDDLMMKLYDPELLSRTLFQHSHLFDNTSGNNALLDIAGTLKVTQVYHDEDDKDLPTSISVSPITTDDDAVSAAAEHDQIELLGDDASLEVSFEIRNYVVKKVLPSRQFQRVDDSTVDLIALSSSKSRQVPASTKLPAISTATASKR
jgi:hypothetical protein